MSSTSRIRHRPEQAEQRMNSCSNCSCLSAKSSGAAAEGQPELPDYHAPVRRRIIIPGDYADKDEALTKMSGAEMTMQEDFCEGHHQVEGLSPQPQMGMKQRVGSEGEGKEIKDRLELDDSYDLGEEDKDDDSDRVTVSDSVVPDCPTGKHTRQADDNNEDKQPCSCVMLNKFDTFLKAEVTSEWHSPKENSRPNLNDFCIARRRIFQGGQGVVYMIKNSLSTSSNEKQLVMKIKERRKDQNRKSWRRDLREVFLLKELSHPFIIELKHAYLTRSFYCLVMEFGSRGSLWSMVSKFGCMPRNLAAYYVACMLSAIQHVHSNDFIFRDLKAENVIVMSDYTPRLIDFGMAKSHNKPDVDNTFTNFYFAAYIAPEVYADPQHVNHKVDSWGIGYLALELIVGYGVFKSLPWTTTRHTHPDWKFQLALNYEATIPSECQRFIARALTRDPNLRPTTNDLKKSSFFSGFKFKKLHLLRPPNIYEYIRVKTGSI